MHNSLTLIGAQTPTFFSESTVSFTAIATVAALMNEMKRPTEDEADEAKRMRRSG